MMTSRSLSVVASLLIALHAAGCSTASLDTNRPIDLRGGDYRQHGQSLNNGDVADKLVHEKSSASMVKTSNTYSTLAYATALPGLAFLGWGIGSAIPQGGSVAWAPTLVGSGILAASITFAVISKAIFYDAVREYNKNFDNGGNRKTTILEQANPWVAVVPDGVASGVSVGF